MNIPWRAQSHAVLYLHELRIHTQYCASCGQHDNGPDVELQVWPVVLLTHHDGGANYSPRVPCACHFVSCDVISDACSSDCNVEAGVGRRACGLLEMRLDYECDLARSRVAGGRLGEGFFSTVTQGLDYEMLVAALRSRRVAVVQPAAGASE